MSAPEWIPYATLGVSAVAAGGASWGAFINRRATRVENRRGWERDQVTERYIDLIRALKSFDTIWIEQVERPLSTSPVPDPTMSAAWAALDNAFGVLFQKATEVMVIARSQVQPLMPLLFGIDIHVLVPVARPTGIPQIAARRIETERKYYTELLMLLIRATRADLGLATRSENRQLRLDVADVRRRAAVSRSEITGESLKEILAHMYAFSVSPVEGAQIDFSVAADVLQQFRGSLTLGSPRPAVAVLVHRDGNVKAAIQQGLPMNEKLRITREMALFVEAGLRGDGMYRDLKDGSRAHLWN